MRELQELLPFLTQQERDEIDKLLSSVRYEWHAQQGPQTAAYNSEADVIGYGGAAGGGKTDLGLGFAGNKHRRSIIFRRVYPLLEGIEVRGKEIFGEKGYNGALHRWVLPSKRIIQLASMKYENDKKNFQGRANDLYVFDEVTEFTESQVRFVTGWNRSAIKGQKCRVLMTFNPPMDEAGEWVTRYFAPWLDDTHPSPAEDGELRWFAMVDGQEVERPNAEPFEYGGETVTPKSRTFFHAKLSDNPILEATGYAATIDAMPEPIRTLLKGKFGAYKIVDPFQVIPSSWVRAAQERWNNTEPSGIIKSVGVDVARGGGDKTVLAPLRLERFDELKKYPGIATPDGQTVAMLVKQVVGEQKPNINVDVIGVGASAYDAISEKHKRVTGINFGSGSDATDRSGKFKFANMRAECYWKFREALDPDYDAAMALPPDRELLGDLCAAKWSIRSGRIYIESKDEIIKRLGRSPDCADAVVLAWAQGVTELPSNQPVQKSKYLEGDNTGWAKKY
jgi:hypothetical protein